MINQGKLPINGAVLDLATLDEQALASSGLAVVEKSRFGHNVSFLLSGAAVEGKSFNVRFFFDADRLLYVRLHLLEDYGPQWVDKEWDEGFLDLQAQAHAEWLGRALGQAIPISEAVFGWGKISVEVDKRGWDASVFVSPFRASASGG